MFARAALAALAALTLGATRPIGPVADAAQRFPASALAAACKGKDGWTDPAPPAHVFGNTWYVGTCGITVLLVTTPSGHVLIDGGMPDAAPLVAASIARLGFSIRDVRWIIHGHEHFDHVGNLAELKRLSGAKVAALAPAAAVLSSGRPAPDDPQFELLAARPMTPVAVDRVLRSGDTLSLGGTVLTAHATSAHSPGSTSWTWKACEHRVCRTMTYADSTSTISAESYRFLDHPQRIAAVRSGLAGVGTLPCGILMTPHPSASDLFGRFASGKLNDVRACNAYARAAVIRFEQRLAAERTTPSVKADQ